MHPISIKTIYHEFVRVLSVALGTDIDESLAKVSSNYEAYTDSHKFIFEYRKEQWTVWCASQMLLRSLNEFSEQVIQPAVRSLPCVQRKRQLRFKRNKQRVQSRARQTA